MPKSTFFNLPDEKRERILKAAIDEFAEYSYHKASVSRIVERAKIPKGSFYQYFENKKDLFIYVISVGVQMKFNAFRETLEKELDFFSVMREIFFVSIRFARDNPKLAMIADRLMADVALRKEIFGEVASQSSAFLMNLIEKGISRGEIDPEVDPEFTAALINSLIVGFGDYIREKDQELTEKDIENLFEKLIRFFENGIRRR